MQSTCTHPVRLLDNKEPLEDAHMNTTAIGSIVAIGHVKHEEFMPQNPYEDKFGEYTWTITPELCAAYHELQEKGYVVASKHETLANTVNMRKPRPAEHRFKTVKNIYISNSLVQLGACRTNGSSITRDVIQVIPRDSLKMHSLTLIISNNGNEHYQCGGTSHVVSYYK